MSARCACRPQVPAPATVPATATRAPRSRTTRGPRPRRRPRHQPPTSSPSDDPKKIQPGLERQHGAIGVGADLVRAADLAALAEVTQSCLLGDDVLILLLG